MTKQTTLEQVTEWLKRELPSGTSIHDPAWWAPRILRMVEEAQKNAAPPSFVLTNEALAKAMEVAHYNIMHTPTHLPAYKTWSATLDDLAAEQVRRAEAGTPRPEMYTMKRGELGEPVLMKGKP